MVGLYSVFFLLSILATPLRSGLFATAAPVTASTEVAATSELCLKTQVRLAQLYAANDVSRCCTRRFARSFAAEKHQPRKLTARAHARTHARMHVVHEEKTALKCHSRSTKAYMKLLAMIQKRTISDCCMWLAEAKRNDISESNFAETKPRVVSRDQG